MKIQNINNKGQSLVVLMVVVVISAIILGLGAQFIALRIKAGEAAKQRVIGSYLVQEALEVTRAIARESWSNISTKPETGNYHPEYSEAEAKWVLIPDGTEEENIILGADTYKRKLIFHKVSRVTVEAKKGNIEPGYIEEDDDPSTRKVTASVTIGDRVFSIDYYLTDWQL